MKRLRSSFSTKLSIYITLVVVCVMMVISHLVFSSAEVSIQKEAFIRAKGEVENTSASVEDILSNVQTSVEQTSKTLEAFIDYPDKMTEILGTMLESNPYIMGTCVSFQANYYAQKGKYYMPYLYHENDSIIIVDNLGNDTYNYFEMDWFKNPVQTNENTWSEPYVDEGGGKVLMTTYSYLLRDKKQNVIGVVTADVSVEDFSEMVLRAKPYDSAYSYMLSRNASYLVHPKKERIFRDNYYQATKGMSDSVVVKSIGDNMLAGNHGRQEFDNNGVISYAFYAPIPSTNWSVGIVVPKSEILKELQEIRKISTMIRFISVIVIFVFVFFITRGMAAKLPLISKAAKNIAQGDFETALPEIRTKDEIQELRDSFEFMRQSVKSYIQDLDTAHKAKHQIEGELQIARVIQLGMVPKIFPPFPERKNIDLFGILTPAKEVGGDLYDFFIDDNKLYFAIGDVSGKGVPASLLMALTRSMFRSMAAYICDVKKIVEYMNKSIAETNDANMFITLFVGVLDLESGKVKFCNAGHNPPVIMSKEKGVKFMDMEVNIPIGVFGDFQYTSETMQMSKGDTLFLYTDGLTEAMNMSNEQFGEKRLLSELEKLTNASVKEGVKTVEKAVEVFVNGQEAHDDLTVLSIQLKEINSKNKQTINLVFKNHISEIEKLSSVIDQLQEQWKVDPALCMGIRLALDESLTNVIMYAYPDENPCEIQVQITKKENQLVFEISDNGIAFDSTESPDADITSSIEERKIGGLGIYMIRQIMDEVSYLRAGDKNILTMVKTIK